MRFLLTSLAVVATVAATNPPPVVSEIDLSAYVGDWYQIADFPQFYESFCSYCTTASYAVNDDGTVAVKNSCRSSLNAKDTTINAKGIFLPNEIAKLKVIFFGFFPGSYWIMKTGPIVDGKYQWALVSDKSRSSLYILSRTPTLDADTFNSCKDFLKENGFDLTKLKMTTQDGCKRTDSDTVTLLSQPQPSTAQEQVSTFDFAAALKPGSETEAACDNYNRIEDGICAESCLGSFVGICPLSVVTSAGQLKKGSCAEQGFTQFTSDLSKKAGPCGTLTFKQYSKPSQQSTSPIISFASAACTNYVRIEDGICAQSCLGSFVGICPLSVVTSAGKLSEGSCESKGYTQYKDDLSKVAGPCGTLTFKEYTVPPVVARKSMDNKFQMFGNFDEDDMAALSMRKASASSCEYYLKVDDGTCAEACLGNFVGICPRSLVASKGSLEKGRCSEKGFTTGTGEKSITAGPCGNVTFDTFEKSASNVPVQQLHF